MSTLTAFAIMLFFGLIAPIALVIFEESRERKRQERRR